MERNKVSVLLVSVDALKPEFVLNRSVWESVFLI